jgi:SAM-dependent methyltransferase
MSIRKLLYTKYHPLWKRRISTGLKKRRLEFINSEILGGQLFNADWLNGKRILEIGCEQGYDFIRFFKNYDVHIVGVDLKAHHLDQENTEFIQLDAEFMPFEDKSFDLCVSFGVLEHIQPIEKLCRVISQINRLSKSYVMLVPSISTVFEPHALGFFWPLRPGSRKQEYSSLNYYSDEAWLQFEGFKEAKIMRFSYIPMLLQNTIIYKFSNKAY